MTEKPLHDFPPNAGEGDFPKSQKVAGQNEDKEPYKPRNKVVEAKENFYDRLNLNVRQVDIFIVICVVIVLLLVIAGKFLF